MASAKGTARQVRDQEARAAREARQVAVSPWVERLARLGYVVRGVLYAVIGLLAVQLAMGAGGTTSNQQGAIAVIGAQPFGRLLLVVMAAGLAGYALWGIVRAVFDPLQKGSDTRGLMQRLGFLFSGVSYAALIPPTVHSITGSGGAANRAAQNAATQGHTASLLALPWGPWLVGLIGLVGIVGGLVQVIQAFRPQFEKEFDTYAVRGEHKPWAIRIGRFGTAARGLVFALTGGFLIQAALQAAPNRVKGVDGALQALAQQPYGPWLLGVVALGLIAFGVYSMLVGAWFRLRRG